MFWVLIAILYAGPYPDGVTVGTKTFATEQSCQEFVKQLEASGPPTPDTLAVGLKCEAFSNPVTQKDAGP